MQKIIVNLLFFLFVSLVFAQNVPQGINWQGVLRGADGAPLENETVSVQFKINESTATGTTVYTQTETVTTNSDGLVTTIIGDVTNANILSTINWQGESYFLETAVDATGGTNYTILGTTQLLSVPYALHSDSSTTLENADGSTQLKAISNKIAINSGLFETFTFTNGKITTIAPIPNFGNNLRLEFKDGSNTNSINNVFPNVTTLPAPSSIDYRLNLNVRGNETLSARGDGTVRINDNYSLPNVDGNSGDVLVTNGNGDITWGGASKLADADGDTQIQVEETTDDDNIRFDIEGTENFRMQKGRLEVLNSGLSIYIGENAGLNNDFSSENENVGIGHGALQQSINSGSNTSVGAFSLNVLTNGSGNTAIGIGALEKSTGGSRNVAIGAGALSTSVGNIVNGTGVDNVAIGYRAGQNNKGSRNVFIGYETDISGNVWNKLVIDNSNTTTPLIAGDFFTDELTINGANTVNGNNTVTGQTTTGTLKVGSSTTLSGIYKVGVSRNIGNIGGNSSRIETFTVTGASQGDVVFVSPSKNLQSQVVVGQAWVSGNNTVSVRFRNTDGGSQDPDGGSGATYYISVIK